MRYQEDINRGLRICRRELSMRGRVFKKDKELQKKKMDEMYFVIALLEEYKETLPSRTGDLFEERTDGV